MTIRVNDKKIYYERLGNGQPLLFVHGWGGTSASLHRLFELASKKYTAIILDLPGFGKSENPEVSWGVGEYGRFLAEFIKELGLKKVIYFGHSFGGTLGIFLGANYPHLIDKLVLSAPSFKRIPRKRPGITFIKRLVGDNPFFKRMAYGLFFRKSDLLKHPHLEPNFRKIMTQDITAATLKVTALTLILWGDEDTYVEIANATELHNNIKGSKLKIYKGERHGLPLKKPEVVMEEIEKFLNTSSMKN